VSAPRRSQFWLGEVDPLPLALYRAGLGALLCAEGLQRLPHAAELFSDVGFHRSRFVVPVPSPTVAYATVLASAAAAAAMALGWRTRLSTLVALALWGWLYAIDQIGERALHSIALVALAMVALSDAGAALSLDARRRGARAAVWATPLRLLQLQFAQVYLFAGVVKLRAPGWLDGVVLARAMSSRWATDAGLWAARVAPDAAWRWMARGAVAYELLAPVLLFVPGARRWVIAAGVALHLGVEATLGVGWLGWHFVLALLTLYPSPEALRRFLKTTGRAARRLRRA
jgi:hypothetical protein